MLCHSAQAFDCFGVFLLAIGSPDINCGRTFRNIKDGSIVLCIIQLAEKSCENGFCHINRVIEQCVHASMNLCAPINVLI